MSYCYWYAVFVARYKTSRVIDNLNSTIIPNADILFLVNKFPALNLLKVAAQDYAIA